MEDTQPAADAAAAARQGQQQGQLRLQKIYIKDVSFETPNSPAVFITQQQVQPQVEFHINQSAKQIQNELHEVTLGVTVTVKLGETTAFLVEVQQAGLFTLSGFTKNHMHYVLGAYCPNMLFPYARETVSDLVLRGGFPPLLLEPVNFDAIYTQQMQKLRDRQQGQAGNVQISETTASA